MRVKVKDLLPDTDYALQFRANDGDSVGEWSQRFKVHTIAKTELPPTPQNVTWTVEGTSFLAKWSAVTISDFSHYEVVIGNGSTSVTYKVRQERFDFPIERNEAAFGSAAGTVTFKVAAVDNTKKKSEYSPLLSASNPAPNPVSGFMATSSSDLVSLKWNENEESDVVGYRLYRGSTLVWSGNATSKTIVVGYDTTATFSIEAVDIFLTASALVSTVVTTGSNPTIVDSDPPPTPDGLVATLETNVATLLTKAIVQWNPLILSDLNAYMIRYRKVGDVYWEQISVSREEENIQITRLEPYIAYEFQIAARDFSANVSPWSLTVSATPATNINPSVPAAPTLAASTLRLQISHSNTKVDASPMEADVVYYEVYASKTNGFTPGPTNMLGTMPVGPAISAVFSIPASAGSGALDTWYAKVIAVDSGNLKSAPSAQSTQTVPLIDSINIADATITAAKITSVYANTIQAGTGIINDLTVKAILTIGDTLSDGFIKSFNWASGVDGWRLDKTGLEINSGAVLAKALRIQNSQNLMQAPYAGFEFTSSYYTFGTSGTPTVFFSTSGVAGAIDSSELKYETQSLKVTNTNGSTITAYLGPNATTNNILIPEVGEYIASAWIRSNVAGSVTLNFNGGSGILASSSVTLVANTWTRIYVTRNFTGTAGRIYFTLPANSIVNIDGVQVEKKISGLDTPSPWSPPGLTSVDGAIIRTGEIRSTTTVTVNGVSQPSWSINTQGGAQFGNALIRGILTVGLSGDPDAGLSVIRSGNYTGSTTGWIIKSDGSAEFNNVSMVGTFTAGSPTAGHVTIESTTDGGKIGFWSALTQKASITAMTGDRSSYTYRLTMTAPSIYLGGDVIITGEKFYMDGTETEIVSRVGNGGVRAPLTVNASAFVIDTGAAGGGKLNLNGDRIRARNAAGDANAKAYLIGTTWGVSANANGDNELRLDYDQVTAWGTGARTGLTLAGSLVTLDVTGGRLRVLGDPAFAAKLQAPDAGDSGTAIVFVGENIRFVGGAYTDTPSAANHRDIFYKTGTGLSDGRFKTDLVEVTNGIEAMKAVPSYDYRFKGEGPQGRIRRGVIAQDVQTVAPSVITDSEGTLFIDAVAYGATVGAAVRELITKSEEQEQQIAELQEQIANLTGT